MTQARHLETQTTFTGLLQKSYLNTLSSNPFLTDLDLEFILEAYRVQEKSKDPNRKVGCVIVKDDRTVASGYNRFPGALSNCLKRFNDPEYKRKSIVHAEFDAVLSALDSKECIKGSTAYITYHPCSQCASCLIHAGIAKVVCPSPISGSPKWMPEFKVASDNLYEAGILVLYYEPLK